MWYDPNWVYDTAGPRSCSITENNFHVGTFRDQPVDFYPFASQQESNQFIEKQYKEILIRWNIESYHIIVNYEEFLSRMIIFSSEYAGG